MVFRYFNPIGSYKEKNMGENLKKNAYNLLPCLCNVANGFSRELLIYGNDWPTKDGTCIRDFIHVIDIAEAHIAALEFLNNQKNSIHFINLGTGKGTSVLELINTFCEVNNVKINIRFAPRRTGDLSEYFADVNLANKILN